MGNLNWTSESIRWLSDIFEYIEADNPLAAQDVVSGIYQ
jgi:plasmid stabilization system protein ParE